MFSLNLEKYLIWYQQRIGLYDKQSWETTVEQRILRGLSYSPRKTAKQKTDLIDVDLVRGSTFPKAKPQSDVWLAGLHGIIRILFLPLYLQWWLKEVSYIGVILVISMYCSVISTFVIYFIFQDGESKIKNVPGSEILVPAALLVLLSIILSQMACTRRKGIKLAFHGKRGGHHVRNGRKSRNSRRDSLSHGGNGSPRTIKEKIKNMKTFNSSNRSQSEDLHFVHTIDYENRSVSENNILLKYDKKTNITEAIQPKIEEITVLKGIDHLKLSPGDKLRYPSSEERVKKDKTGDEDCNIRYRGCASNLYMYRGGEKDLSSPKNSIEGFINNRFEKSSDGLTDDGEEGCHADCEGPSTDDEDYSNVKEKRPKFKLGPNLLVHRRSLSPQKIHPLPKSDQTIPIVMVQDDGSVSSCESEGDTRASSLPLNSNSQKPLFGDWIGITTNSEDPSYSSESEPGWDEFGDTSHQGLTREPIDWHIQGAPAAVISSTAKDVDKVGCKIWEDTEMKKVDLSVLDISSAIISRVDSLRQSSSYLMFGLIMSGILSLVPCLYRILMTHEVTTYETSKDSNLTEFKSVDSSSSFMQRVFGNNMWCITLITLNAVNRVILGSCFFFLLSVAERTFKQRFLYAKHFCYLTSARRARKYDLPHFRLNKVTNIKSWLSIRSCLKKRGPQHSVDVIISATFIVTLLLVFYLGVEALKDEEEKAVQPLHNCELFVWCFAVSIYLIRFMTLGALINKKYSNPSVLITEQINMYLHMEQNPQKKDNLTLANNVLKLVSVLLKELDSPFKISGLSANTLLYNITKFGILSACSGVLSNLLGFKLKLHNIKFR